MERFIHVDACAKRATARASGRDPRSAFLLYERQSGGLVDPLQRSPAAAFDAVIPRIGSAITYYGTAALRQFELLGSYPLNESVAITRARDKLRSLQLLARQGIDLPLTGIAHSPMTPAI
jgi:ribosomal protein S6--L-glutamate ligase